MEEESILWHNNGESLMGLVPITPPPYPHGHPSEGRQYYYANEERQKRLARFFSAVDEQAAAGVGPGGSPLTETEFRAAESTHRDDSEIKQTHEWFVGNG